MPVRLSPLRGPGSAAAAGPTARARLATLISDEGSAVGKYVIRRLLQMIPVVIGATFMIFAMVFALGNPVAGRCGQRPCSAGLRRQVQHGVPPRPASAGAVRLLPRQAAAGRPRHQLLRQHGGRTSWPSAIPTTIKLALIAVIFEIIIGIAAGVLAGIKRGRFLDNLVLISTLVVISIPIFVIGSLAQLIFGVQLGIFPVDRHPGHARSADPARHSCWAPCRWPTWPG